MASGDCDWRGAANFLGYECFTCHDRIGYSAIQKSGLPVRPCPALVQAPPPAQKPPKCSIRLTGNTRPSVATLSYDEEYECTICLGRFWQSAAAVFMLLPDCPGPAAVQIPALSNQQLAAIQNAGPIQFVPNMSLAPLPNFDEMFESRPMKPKPKPKRQYDRCLGCDRELSPLLDAYYGKDPVQKAKCVDCRKGKASA